LQTQPQQPQAGVRRVVVALREIADPVAVEGVTDPGLKALAKSLQPHQRAAVNFLWHAATNSRYVLVSTSVLFLYILLARTPHHLHFTVGRDLPRREALF